MRILRKAILIIISVLIIQTWLSCASNVQQINNEEFRYLASEKNISFKVITQDQSEYQFRNYSMQNDTIILHPQRYLFYKPDIIYIPLNQIEYASATPVSPDLFSLKSLIIIVLFYSLISTLLVLSGFAGAMR